MKKIVKKNRYFQENVFHFGRTSWETIKPEFNIEKKMKKEVRKA